MQVLAGFAAIVCIGSVARAQEEDVHALVAEGTQAFTKGDYATALETYRMAELMMPRSPELAYNQGVACYMLGDYAQARDAFNRSLLTRNVELEARIKFNLGNVGYASALKGVSNPPEAIGLLKSAIAHYRDVLELDPEDDDARINIELAQQLIKNLLEKLDQQREERRQQQDDQQERQQSDQGQQQQGGQQGGQQEVGAGQQRREQLGEPANDRMTRQEVERLLQAGRDRERQRRNELARRLRVGGTPVAKDW